MAYDKTAGMGTHFIPRGTTVLGSENLLGAVAVHGGWVCVKRCKVKALLFTVDTAVVTPGAVAVAKAWKQTPPGNTATQVAVGTLTFPVAGLVAGKVLRKAVTPIKFNVGDELSFDHTTQVSGTSAAGIGYYGIEADQQEEVPGGETNITASA